jgi:UDP-glucose 4-epimerase
VSESLCRVWPILSSTVSSYHNSSPKATQSIEKLASTLVKNPIPSIEVHNADLAEFDQVEKVFKEYDSQGGIWGVIHIAAHKAVGESMEKPIQYFRNNIKGLENLLEVRFSAFGFSASFSS